MPVYYPIRAFEKIQIEAPYHALTNAGHISYVELDGDTCKNLEAFEAVIRYMKEQGIGYGSVNHPVDRDPVCGYTGVIDDVCPRCGRRAGESVSIEKLNELRKKYGCTNLSLSKEDEVMTKREMKTKEIGQDIGFDRIRRITGYLVGTTERFNNAKRAEERDRVKHGI